MSDSNTTLVLAPWFCFKAPRAPSILTKPKPKPKQTEVEVSRLKLLAQAKREAKAQKNINLLATCIPAS